MVAVTIALLILAFIAFLMRTMYVARFGLRDRMEQPFHYERMKRRLNRASTVSVLAASIATALRSEYLIATAVIIASFIITQLLGFRNYRRAVEQMSESRMDDGQFVFAGTPAEREKAAMLCLKVYMETGERS
jgi:ATP/ADP translocase